MTWCPKVLCSSAAYLPIAMDPSDSTKATNDDVPTVVILSSVVTLVALVTTTIWLCRQLTGAYGRARQIDKAENETIEPLSDSTNKPVKEAEPNAEEDVTENVADGETDS